MDILENITEAVRLFNAPVSRRQIAEETKLSPRELVGLLVSLELQGYAREITKNNYVAAET